MKILAIETSCDDTSIAVVENGTKVLSSVVSSQVDLHTNFGGVVPEVAARAHMQNILPVLESALLEANTTIQEIDYIAVTRGPGLIGSLIVGVNTARTLAKLHNIPLISVHHTEGHIYANWLSENLQKDVTPPEFPLICLTVSGGHTNIIFMKDHLDYKIVGQTIDDAAGEAFDKVAKMLGLGYPGGPIVSKCAESGCETKFNFPRVDLTKAPQRGQDGFLKEIDESLDFSFSGIKTAVLKEVRAIEKTQTLNQSDIDNISASFQKAAVEILTRNLLRAIEKYKPRSILLSGGVAANNALKEHIFEALKIKGLEKNFYFPKSKYCTDNAAMIAAAAYYHVLAQDYSKSESIYPDPNLKL